MKKAGIALVTFMCSVVLAACSAGNTTEVEINYGSSTIYTQEDMDAAIQVIQDQFKTWEGCELHSLTYGSDEACNVETIAWMNDLEAANGADETFTQCIMFESSFRSPKNGGGAWEPDTEYTWQWWLARSEGGEWKLMTWGVG